MKRRKIGPKQRDCPIFPKYIWMSLPSLHHTSYLSIEIFHPTECNKFLSPEIIPQICPAVPLTRYFCRKNSLKHWHAQIDSIQNGNPLPFAISTVYSCQNKNGASPRIFRSSWSRFWKRVTFDSTKNNDNIFQYDFFFMLFSKWFERASNSDMIWFLKKAYAARRSRKILYYTICFAVAIRRRMPMLHQY